MILTKHDQIYLDTEKLTTDLSLKINDIPMDPIWRIPIPSQNPNTPPKFDKSWLNETGG